MNFPVQSEDLEILQQARDSWHAGNRQLALEQFKTATQRHPTNVRALVESAMALGKTYRIEESCQLLESAKQIGGRQPEIASEIAKCYVDIYRISEAIECLETIPEDDRTPENYGQLAVYYEQTGQFEEAEDAINLCIDNAPDDPEPNLILARVLADQGKLKRAHNVLVHLRKSLQNPHPRLAIRTYYELAGVLDRLGDFDNAFQAAEHAKTIQKQFPDAESNARRIIEQGFGLASIYQRLDVDTLDRWLTKELPPLPGFVRPAHLLGFPRSGTTLLEQVLDAHPEIVTSSERPVFADEILPRLFDHSASPSSFDALESNSEAELCELRQHYFDCLQATHTRDLSHKLHLDKKPANTTLMCGLLRFLPESRFLIAIRDPRDVIVSCFMRFFSLTDMSCCFLSWGGAAMIYAQYMEIWLYMKQILPEDQWLEVRYEKVCQGVAEPAAEVFDFLGLSKHPGVNDYLATTKQKYVHSPTFAEVRRPVHQSRVGRWENYAKYLEPQMDKIEPFVSALGYD